jgi:hypothetical protein
MKISFHKNARGQYFDQEGNPLTGEQVQDFVATAYAKIGLIFSGPELKSEADGWYVGVDDNDDSKYHWFFAYKTTPFGKKIFAMGHDGSPEAKKEMMEFRREQMLDKSKHFYVEASGRVEQIMQSWGLPKVPFEIAKMVLPGKQLEPQDEFAYSRAIAGKPFIKTMYGYPIIPHSASWKNALLQPAEGKGFARPS